MTEFAGNPSATTGLSEEKYAPVFSWKNPGGRRLRLGIFLAAALTLHALLFYLFQVVYPPSRRLVRQPAGITVLTSADPASVTLLNKVAQRTPAFEGGMGESAALLAVRENFVADYVATYHGYHPQIKAPNSTILPKPLPLLATPGAITLPAIPKSVRPAVQADPTPPIQTVATLVLEDHGEEGTKEGRWAIRSPQPALPASVATELAALASPPRLRVGVDERGRVLFVGAIDLLPAALEKPLRAAVSRLSFGRLAADAPPLEATTLALKKEPTLPLVFLRLSVAWVDADKGPE